MPYTTQDAALDYAARGWRVLPLAQRAKRPVTTNGVLDATTNEIWIADWWSQREWNVGIATGAPGPDVVDIDRPEDAAELMTRCRELGAPEVRTGKGIQFYFAGTDGSTVRHDAGEIRRLGAYVVAPPSIHPNGGVYCWDGSGPDDDLPVLPDGLVVTSSGLGSGVALPAEHVPPGQMHMYLTDLAVRLTRAGIVDEDTLAACITAVYEAKRVPGQQYGGTAEDDRTLARWAAQSEIAAREQSDAFIAKSGGRLIGNHNTTQPIGSRVRQSIRSTKYTKRGRIR